MLSLVTRINPTRGRVQQRRNALGPGPLQVGGRQACSELADSCQQPSADTNRTENAEDEPSNTYKHAESLGPVLGVQSWPSGRLAQYPIDRVESVSKRPFVAVWLGLE